MKIKKLTALLLCAVLILALPGCGSEDKYSEDAIYSSIPESTGGKDVQKAEQVDNAFSLNSNSKYSFNPLTATNHSNQLICSLVYENMLDVDNSFNVISNIVNAEESFCNDDGTYWTLKVNEGHTFHDGSPVTGKDVYYSIERSIWSDRYRGRFASYQGASYTEDTVFVSLGVGNKQMIKLLNLPVIKYGTNGDDYPIGSGPYTYNEDHTQLLAYEGFAGYKDLDIKTIYIKEYTSAVDIISAFEDGYIDLVLNDPSSYSNLGYADINERHSYATTNMHYVMFNMSEGVGQIPAFRFALSYAFDRARLPDLLGGYAVASAVPMYPTCEYYPTTLNNSLEYNMDTCKVILENAGCKVNNGVYTYNGQEIELDFVLCSDSSAKAGIANRFADEMEKLGIIVNIHSLSWDDYITALEDGEFDLYYGEVKLRNDFDITELLQVRDEDNEKTNINYSGSHDESYMGYINAYLTASELDRSTKYYQLCDYVCSTGSIITIGFERQEVISHRGVIKGMNPNAGNPLYDYVNWTIDLE